MALQESSQEDHSKPSPLPVQTLPGEATAPIQWSIGEVSDERRCEQFRLQPGPDDQRESGRYLRAAWPVHAPLTRQPPSW